MAKKPVQKFENCTDVHLKEFQEEIQNEKIDLFWGDAFQDRYPFWADDIDGYYPPSAGDLPG